MLSLLWLGEREGWVSRPSPCLLNPHLFEEQTGRSSWLQRALEKVSFLGSQHHAPLQFGRGGQRVFCCSLKS